MKNLFHLTASTFFGGPERQMLGLADQLAPVCRTTFVLFPEGQRWRPFADQATARGHEVAVLTHDSPRLVAVLRELDELFTVHRPDVLCCHGYKADILGGLAGRRRGVPTVGVSRGWTGESWKVRLFEMLDRAAMRRLDRVVCVSAGQAVKVRRAGVADDRLCVIRNAIRADRFRSPDPAFRDRLQAYFPRPKRQLVGAAGRLSPEKGFGLLVEAARRVVRDDPQVGFVLFGDGPLRDALAARVAAVGLAEHFALAGFRPDLDHFLPHLDAFVLPSFTEGLPNVVLEAFAAEVPVVATAVGGTPEVVDDGVNGFLVPPGNPLRLAGRLLDLLGPDTDRRLMGQRGRQRVLDQFTFAAQARQYVQLFEDLTGTTWTTTPAAVPLRKAG